MKSYEIILIVISLSIAGCTMMPYYKRPLTPVPEKFSTKRIYKKVQYNNGTSIKLNWHNFFKDKKLKKIIKIALQNNRDLRLAMLNVEYSRNYYGIQKASLYPSLYLTGIRNKQRIPKDLSSTKRAYNQGKYEVDLGIAEWEIDFFGRIRSLSKKALEEFFAQEENQRAARLTLISEISRVYFTLASDMENLRLAKEILNTRLKNYELVKKQYELGIATKIDLSMAKGQVNTARLTVISLKEQIEKDKNALNLLAGKEVPEKLMPCELPSSPLKEFSPSLSSEILLNRPDIMAAEHKLKAAYADIGVARAALFPRISLISAMGSASNELAGLFKPGSETWKYGINISMPLFDARVWKAYKLSKVQRKIVLTQYERTIQKAFREVMDLLCVKAVIKDKIKAQSSLLKSLKTTYEIALNRYKQGIDTYFPVLNAQKELLKAQIEFTKLKLAKVANDIELYVALGGGPNISY